MQQAELNELIAQHRAEVFGYFRVRTKDDATAHDLEQRTWVEVLRRVQTYDPEQGTFRTFVMNWVKIVRKRWLEECATTRLVFESHKTGDEENETPGLYERTAGPGFDIEERLTLSEAYLELLKLSARCTRPPHEVIGFGLNLLEYKPSEVVADLADEILFDLEGRLEREYAALAPLPVLHAALLPLRTRLALSVRDVMDDPRTQEKYEPVVDLSHVTGETTLREYFRPGQTAEDEVGRWSASVKKAVLSAIRRSERGILREWLRGEADPGATPSSSGGS